MFLLGKFRQERPRRDPLYYVVWALALGETRYIMWCGLSSSSWAEIPAILCGVGSRPRLGLRYPLYYVVWALALGGSRKF